MYPLPDDWKDLPNLTYDQVKALPFGTTIYVMWSGGNGWHRYNLDRCESLCVAMHEHDKDPKDAVMAMRELYWIGEPPLTAVKAKHPCCGMIECCPRCGLCDKCKPYGEHICVG